MELFAEKSEERFFTPEPCRNCEIYQKYPDKIIGWEVKSPLGLFKISGCQLIGKRMCPYRYTQCIIIGVNPTSVFDEISYTLSEILELYISLLLQD